MSGVNWTNVLVALIAGLPAIIAAVGVLLVHKQIQTPSGKSLGEVAEYAHDTAIANNLLLSQQSGHTKQAATSDLHEEGKTPPQVPDEQQG